MGIMRAGRNLPRWARTAVVAVALWDLAWKGLALWQAAKRRQPVWFAGLLFLNTAGALPITYLVLMKRRDRADAQASADAQYAQGWGAPEDA
jgi:Family of unknown function (DUF5652)